MFASSADSLRIAIVNASTWTALEWIRGWMFTGFGWNGLGVALHENHVLIQVADVVGVTGLSFFVMLAVSVGTTTVYRIVFEIRHARIRPHADFFAVLAVFMGLILYGTHRIRQVTEAEHSPQAESLQCLVIQPNVSQDIKWEELYADELLSQLYEMTATGAVPDLDLVVWPETAVPFALQSPTAQDLVDRVLQLGEFTLITGFNDVQSDTEFYNALALFHGDYFNVRLYRKTHLVPFGEYIPFRETFPPFEWIAGGEVTDDYTRGSDTSPMPIASESQNQPEIVPLICFEDTVGNLVRRFHSANPQVIVTITNNGWFYQSANSQQHVANAKFRCIELRRPMIRAANTGVSCYIGPAGDVRSHVHDPESGTTFISGALLAQVKISPQSEPTFYAVHGDLFAKALGLLALALVTLSFRRSK
jgi:apolipoprotein N-acyltransferase